MDVSSLDFIKEFKVFFGIFFKLVKSQQVFEELISKKILNIDYLLEHLLKLPSNPKTFQRLRKIHEHSISSYLKGIHNLREEAPSNYKSFEDYGKNLGFSLETQKPIRSTNNKENVLPTCQKPQKVQTFLLENKYSKMIMRKLKAQGTSVFARRNLRKPIFKNELLRNFNSHSCYEDQRILSQDQKYYSERLQTHSVDDSRRSPEFERNNIENYRTPEKRRPGHEILNVLSENVEFETEDTKVHDISRPVGSKVVSTPHHEPEVTVLETPLKEKKVIGTLMKKEYKNEESWSYHQANFGETNETKYVISAHWWKQWVDYVKFEEKNDGDDSFETSPIKEERGGIRPGIIINKSLKKINLQIISIVKRHLIDEEKSDLVNKKRLVLKENLLEHLDFEAVPKHIYVQLRKWYDTDFEILRSLKKDPACHTQVFLELYPEKVLLNEKYKFEPLNKRKKKLLQANSHPLTPNSIFKTNNNKMLDKNCHIF